MKIGISAYNLRVRDFISLAAAVEQAGFDSLWLGEHLVLPSGYASLHPAASGDDDRPDNRAAASASIIDPTTELLDPWVALAAAATSTSSIRLGTAIYLLPLRHPLLTARAAATLADLSRGRFLLGVGAGWLREEFDAFGVPFNDRGARHEESVQVLQAAFAGGPFTFQGKYFHLDEVQISARPVAVPIVLGGNSEPALRRAARLGDAWFASGNPVLEEAVRLRDRLEELCQTYGRSGRLEYHIRATSFDPSLVATYEAEGIDSLIFWAHHLAPPGTDDVPRAFRDGAARLGLP